MRNGERGSASRAAGRRTRKLPVRQADVSGGAAGQTHIRVSVRRAVSAGGHVQPLRRHSKGGAQSASALKPAAHRMKLGVSSSDLSGWLNCAARARQSGRPASPNNRRAVRVCAEACRTTRETRRCKRGFIRPAQPRRAGRTISHRPHRRTNGAQSASALKPAVQRAKLGIANADLSGRLSRAAR